MSNSAIRPLPSVMGGIVATPKITPTRKAQATVVIRQAIPGYSPAIHRVDFRRLERNKYAPWGRGDLSGLPLK